MPKEELNASGKALVFGLVVGFLPWLSSGLFTTLFLNYPNFFRNQDGLFILTSGVIWGILCALALGNPTFLALAYGYLLGYRALVLLLLSYTLSIFCIYFFMKILRLEFLKKAVAQNPMAARLEKIILKNELAIIFYAKLSPVLPFALTNICFVLSGAKLKNIVLGGILGMIPRTLLAVYTGMQAKNLQEILKGQREADYQDGLLIMILLVSIWGLYYSSKKVKIDA